MVVNPFVHLDPYAHDHLTSDQETYEEITFNNVAKLLHTLIDALYAMHATDGMPDLDLIVRKTISLDHYQRLFGIALILQHLCLECGGMREAVIGHCKLRFKGDSPQCICPHIVRPKKRMHKGNGRRDGGGNQGGNEKRRSTSESESSRQSPSSQNSPSSGFTPSSGGSSSSPMDGFSLAGNASDSTTVKLETVNETRSGNTETQVVRNVTKKSRRRKRNQGNKKSIETADPPPQPSETPASPAERPVSLEECPRNGKNAAASQESDGELEGSPKTEPDVEREQPEPSQVDSLVERMTQVSLSDDVAPAETQVENSEQQGTQVSSVVNDTTSADTQPNELVHQMLQVSLSDVVPHTTATPTKDATEMLPATPSSPTSKHAWDLFVNHNDPKQGVGLYQNISCPDSYMKKAKEENPNVEWLGFPTGEVEDFLQTDEVRARASMTSEGNLTWKGDAAAFVWKWAQDLHGQSDTRLNTPAYETPVKARCSTPNSPTSRSKSALLINHNDPTKGVTLYYVGNSEKYFETVKGKSPLAESLKFSSDQVDDLLHAIGTKARISFTKNGNPTWKDENAKLAWKVAKVFSETSDLESAANVKTPAKATPSSPSSSKNPPTRAVLITDPTHGATLYENIHSPEWNVDKAKKGNPLVEAVEIQAEQVNTFVKMMDVLKPSSLTTHGNRIWKPVADDPREKIVFVETQGSPPPPPYSENNSQKLPVIDASESADIESV
ncbi:hypothetical protein HDU77_009750 [Chytriomyces hyalinus]|nr:hypothetical protein HDU77_009750 [Chytriomyces hyalinus]